MVGIKRLNISTMNIILYNLQNNGKAKRTNLALYSRIPYDRFSKYLNKMIVLELVTVEKTDDGIFVHITELGRKFHTHCTSECC